VKFCPNAEIRRENVMAASIQDELIAACRQPGCPVCRLVHAGVRHYLQNIFYESVNDIDLRKQLRDSLGFCMEHARISLQPGVGDALGVSIIYNDILTNLLRRLPDVRPSASRGTNILSHLRSNRSISASTNQLQQALTPKTACPACVQREELERIFCPALGAHLADETLANALQAGDGLCLPHLRRVAPEVKDDGDWLVLLGSERARLESLQAELAEFIRKSDYRFHDESIGFERDAWRRSVRWVTGEVES
jgi:Family of unknown function (DUF6062)